MTDYFNYECVGQLSLFDNYNIHKAETFTFDDIKNNTNILSVFDGMACGMLAFLGCGFNVKRYVAYEIDSYAVKTTQHNFPFIEHKGDVFNADFTEYADFDFLVGGSPCTYWSIAQTKNRETIASGMGWELFQQYVRALKEAKPKFFIYENNKSMSKQIRESITETFGFQPICINSALVSAQTRNRLYWVGIRNGDGSYRKANIQQPKERGILVQNILETKTAIPLNIKEEGKSQTLKAQYAKNSISNFVGYTSTYGATGVAEPVRVGSLPSPDGVMRGGQGMRIYSTQGKAVSLKGNAGGAGGKTGLYAIPVEQECLKVKEATSKGYTLIEVGGVR